jgi:Hint domain
MGQAHPDRNPDSFTPPPCYVTGTRLTAPEGAVRVEDVAVGTMVLTASGEPRAVRWVGHRTVHCALAPDPASVWPVQIKAGAFADQQPSGDLWVSPGHSIFVSGVLIPAVMLVNGATIVQVPTESIEYWHVELDQHDVLLAEGLAAESYLDQGNRTDFDNGGDFVTAHPDFKPKHWAETCAPLIVAGEVLESVRTSLLVRAQQLGHQITAASDAHIVADGQRIEPVFLREDRLAFMLPAQCSTIELRSRSYVPAHVQPASNDLRSLGLCVGRLQVDCNDVQLDDDTAFSEGWHGFETTAAGTRQRWSGERAALPSNSRLIVIDLTGPGFYWCAAAQQGRSCPAGGLVYSGSQAVLGDL